MLGQIAPSGSKGRRFKGRTALAYLGVILGALAILVGAGILVSGGSARILTSAEARHLLLELPYRYRFRPVPLPRGASGALAGTAIGRHYTILHFGFALGREPHPVPVPHSGISEVSGYSGFVFTDDELVPGKRQKWEAGPQFHTAAQWKEASRMSVAMVERLCRASTHQPCPVGG